MKNQKSDFPGAARWKPTCFMYMQVHSRPQHESGGMIGGGRCRPLAAAAGLASGKSRDFGEEAGRAVGSLKQRRLSVSSVRCCGGGSVTETR